MNVKPNSNSGKTSTSTSILVDIDIIQPAVYLFLIERNTRFEVFWPKLHSFKQQYPPPNLPGPDIDPLA